LKVALSLRAFLDIGRYKMFQDSWRSRNFSDLWRFCNVGVLALCGHCDVSPFEELGWE
jgi:hypothetical protein